MHVYRVYKVHMAMLIETTYISPYMGAMSLMWVVSQAYIQICNPVCSISIIYHAACLGMGYFPLALHVEDMCNGANVFCSSWYQNVELGLTTIVTVQKQNVKK